MKLVGKPFLCPGYLIFTDAGLGWFCLILTRESPGLALACFFLGMALKGERRRGRIEVGGGVFFLLDAQAKSKG